MQPNNQPASDNQPKAGDQPTLPPATPLDPAAAQTPQYPTEPDGSGDSSFHDRAAGRVARGEESQVAGDHAVHPTAQGQVPPAPGIGQQAPTTAPPLPGQHPLPGETLVPNPPVGTTMPGVDRPLTFGERAVGLTFNPSNNHDVQTVKTIYAALIDKHHAARTEATDPELKRLHAVAITELQTAQMWSVKSLTWSV